MAGDDQWTALAWPWASLEPAPRRACVPSPRYRPRVTERFQFRLIHSTLGDRDGTPADVEALAGFARTRAIGHGNPRLSRIPHAAGEQHGSTDVRFSRSALVRPFGVHVYRCDPGKQDARAAKTDETIDGRIRSSMIGGACSATMAGYFFGASRPAVHAWRRCTSRQPGSRRFGRSPPFLMHPLRLGCAIASGAASTPRRHRAASTTQSEAMRAPKPAPARTGYVEPRAKTGTRARLAKRTVSASRFSMRKPDRDAAHAGRIARRLPRRQGIKRASARSAREAPRQPAVPRRLLDDQ